MLVYQRVTRLTGVCAGYLLYHIISRLFGHVTTLSMKHMTSYDTWLAEQILL